MRFGALIEPAPGEAVSTPEGALEYRELRAASAAVAAALPTRGRVAVWATNELATVIGVVGAVAAGVPFVPLNPKLGDHELAHVLADARPVAVIASAAARLPEGIAELPRIEPEAAAAAAAAGAAGDDAPDADAIWARAHDDAAPAMVMYTSGTTGPPKGVVLSRGAIDRNLAALADAWAWTGDDVLVHGLPLFHVHGLVLGLLGPLRLGGAVRHLGAFDPQRVADALHAGATMLFGVPTMYHRLARAAEEDARVADALRSARLLVSGSAALPAADHDRIERACGQRIVERYGMTETLMIASVRHDGERRAGYVVLRSPSLFDGYLHDEAATAGAFRDGWFVTGDLGTRSPDGYLRLVGRRSTDLIKSGGYRIGAGEVEAALLTHPGVGEAAVLGVADPDLGERIVAWVVAAGDPPPDPQALIDHVAAALTPHKRPREVRFVADLPRNAMGKVRKRDLGAAG